jgi:hypothetical protein
MPRKENHRISVREFKKQIPKLPDDASVVFMAEDTRCQSRDARSVEFMAFLKCVFACSNTTRRLRRGWNALESKEPDDEKTEPELPLLRRKSDGE